MPKALKKYLCYFLILVYVSGAIGILFRPSFFLPFTPYTLCLTTLVFLIFQPLRKKSYVFSFIAITVVGFLLEVVGVKSGLVFGHYFYGSNLGYKVLAVPLVISLNWAVLLSGGLLLARSCTANTKLVPLISAFFVTAIDYLIEQVAAPMDWWYFDRGVAGSHNYIAWFLITLSGSVLLQKQLSIGNKNAAYLVIGLQVLFFGVLNLYKLLNIY
ncbi:hypothetical protein CNR22_04110 [Sphingobacteriaceae bacterium]|nr:hypothetical protein CNR22_04110 [Sphingobacteriaceae bacterium]